ncbi:MAG: hypothetical protein IJU59_02795, partial [Firmicutes bacterium]|nr:hypothetical protein [Bacillota bacterium]
ADTFSDCVLADAGEKGKTNLAVTFKTKSRLYRCTAIYKMCIANRRCVLKNIVYPQYANRRTPKVKNGRKD